MNTNENIKDIKSIENEIIKSNRLPVHIAIITDGNGRWATNKGLKPEDGHKAGVKAVKKIVRYSGQIGIKVLTLYTFSTENWTRPQSEVSALMGLLKSTAEGELDELMENNVKLIATGEIDELPLASRKAIEYVINKTKNNTGLILNLALNYSGQEEIVRAVKLIVNDINKKQITVDGLKPDVFEKYLYHPEIPHPDLIIRTSGENRISNFLLWQSAYAEFYLTKTLWPDFDEYELAIAILDYIHRERRFGGRNVS